MVASRANKKANNMKYFLPTITLMIVAILSSCSPDPVEQAGDEGADLILINARVYTLNWDDPQPGPGGATSLVTLQDLF